MVWDCWGLHQLCAAEAGDRGEDHGVLELPLLPLALLLGLQAQTLHSVRECQAGAPLLPHSQIYTQSPVSPAEHPLTRKLANGHWECDIGHKRGICLGGGGIMTTPLAGSPGDVVNVGLIFVMPVSIKSIPYILIYSESLILNPFLVLFRTTSGMNIHYLKSL